MKEDVNQLENERKGQGSLNYTTNSKNMRQSQEHKLNKQNQNQDVGGSDELINFLENKLE